MCIAKIHYPGSKKLIFSKLLFMVYNNKIMKFGEHTGELKSGQGRPNESFVREKSEKDRFGNRYLTSKVLSRFGHKSPSSEEFSYSDNVGSETSAGILISPEGQKFIAEHPGILRKIEEGLVSFETNFKKPNSTIDLRQGISLQATVAGSQSHVYILRIGAEKYVLKTHIFLEPEEKKLYQPYINEMLQTQTIATDLKSDLEKLKVKMSNFLFASGQVSCTRFEEDVKNYAALDKDRLIDLYLSISNYILEKRYDNDPLWENITMDLPVSSPKLAITALNNFRTKPDGTIVCIDPFIYNTK